MRWRSKQRSPLLQRTEQKTPQRRRKRNEKLRQRKPLTQIMELRKQKLQQRRKRNERLRPWTQSQQKRPQKHQCRRKKRKRRKKRQQMSECGQRLNLYFYVQFIFIHFTLNLKLVHVRSFMLCCLFFSFFLQPQSRLDCKDMLITVP